MVARKSWGLIAEVRIAAPVADAGVDGGAEGHQGGRAEVLGGRERRLGRLPGPLLGGHRRYLLDAAVPVDDLVSQFGLVNEARPVLDPPLRHDARHAPQEVDVEAGDAAQPLGGELGAEGLDALGGRPVERDAQRDGRIVLVLGVDDGRAELRDEDLVEVEALTRLLGLVAQHVDLLVDLQPGRVAVDVCPVAGEPVDADRRGRGRRRALRTGDKDPVRPLLRQAELVDVEQEVGGAVAQALDLVHELRGDGAAVLGPLGDERGAVLGDRGDREAEHGVVGDLGEAGGVAAGRLRTALDDVRHGDRPGGLVEPVALPPVPPGPGPSTREALATRPVMTMSAPPEKAWSMPQPPRYAVTAV